jgi:hemolysin activation/secretion protein
MLFWIQTSLVNLTFSDILEKMLDRMSSFYPAKIVTATPTKIFDVYFKQMINYLSIRYSANISNYWIVCRLFYPIKVPIHTVKKNFEFFLEYLLSLLSDKNITSYFEKNTA